MGGDPIGDSNVRQQGCRLRNLAEKRAGTIVLVTVTIVKVSLCQFAYIV